MSSYTSTSIGPMENNDRGYYKWFVVAMLWCITFFNYADRMALNANMPLIRDAFGLDKATGGMLGSAFGYSYGLCAIFAGFIVDRVQRRKAVLVGLTIWSLICVATGFSHHFWLLFMFLAMEGLGEAFYFPAAMSMMSDYHGKATRSRAMSINQTSVYIGTIGGTYFAGKLGQRWGWESAFWVFGGLGFVLAIILWKFLREPQRGQADINDAATAVENTESSESAAAKSSFDTTEKDTSSFFNSTSIIGLLMVLIGALSLLKSGMPALTADILGTVKGYAPCVISILLGAVLLGLRAFRKDKQFWAFFRVFFTTPTAILLLLAFFCANSVAMILLVWMPSFVLEHVYNNDIAMLATAGLLATMPLQLASMLGSPAGGVLADFARSKTPRGRVLVQMVGVLCAVPFVFLCGQSHGGMVLVSALAGWGLFKGIYDSNIFASVYDVIHPKYRGMAAGFMNMFGWAGGAVAPIIAGSIADNKNLGMGYAISGASAVYIVSGLLLFCAAMVFIKWDIARLQRSLKAEAEA